MQTREIPATGESIPVIGMGTWQTFDEPAGRRRDALVPVLEAFFAGGGRVIDSSPMYGRSEEAVGELLGKLPTAASPFLASKVWTSGRDAGRSEIERSIQRMAKPTGASMDLMQVHNLLDYETQAKTLRDLKADGTIRYWGVTHYQLGAFEKLERILERDNPDFVQLPYSLGVREAEHRLLPAAQSTGTAVLVMRPFEGGELFRRVRGKSLPEWAAAFDCKSWAQYFLKFIIAHPAVTCPIPATSKVEHMRDNVRAGHGRLPDEATRKKMISYLDS